MPTLQSEINNSRLYLGSIIDYFQLWKDVRTKVKLLSDHLTNIEDNWEKFADLAPLLGSGSVATMGSNSKSDDAPDDMAQPPALKIGPKQVFLLYYKALELGFEFGENHLYIPTMITTEVPVEEATQLLVTGSTTLTPSSGDFISGMAALGIPTDPASVSRAVNTKTISVTTKSPEYNDQLNESIEVWTTIGELYFQIKDDLYKIGALRSSFGPLQKLVAIDSNPGDVGTERSPGQLALNFPVSSVFLIKNAHPKFNRYRFFDEFAEEYFYWINRSTLEMIQTDAPNYKVKAEVIKTASEYIDDDDNNNKIYTFSAAAGTIIVGADFCKATMTPQTGNPVENFEYGQVGGSWEWDYNCETNEIRLLLHTKDTLSDFMFIAETLQLIEPAGEESVAGSWRAGASQATTGSGRSELGE